MLGEIRPATGSRDAVTSVYVGRLNALPRLSINCHHRHGTNNVNNEPAHYQRKILFSISRASRGEHYECGSDICYEYSFSFTATAVLRVSNEAATKIAVPEGHAKAWLILALRSNRVDLKKHIFSSSIQPRTARKR